MTHSGMTDALNLMIETPDIETSSEDYASRFSGAAGRWMLSVQERAIMKLLRGRGIRTVLDVGGGHGQLTEALLREGYEVTVFGSDPVCKKRVARWVDGGKCHFAAGNLLALPFKGRQFDAVVSIRLLSHMEQWTRLVRELTRVARHTVIVDYPTVRSLNFLTPFLFGAKKKIEKNTRAYLVFDEAHLTREYLKHGFRRTRRHAQFFVPMVVHRMLKSPGASAALEFAPRWTGLTAFLGSPVIGRFDRTAAS